MATTERTDELLITFDAVCWVTDSPGQDDPLNTVTDAFSTVPLAEAAVC